MLSGHQNLQLCFVVLVKVPLRSGIYRRARKIFLLLMPTIFYSLIISINFRLDPICVASSADQRTLTAIDYTPDADVSPRE